jgi:hypothetical protein
MLETADIALLSVVGVEFLAFGLWSWFSIRREKAIAQKYPLYKVRDDLVYLVAEDKLSEDEELFQLFYGFTNHLIKTTKKTLSLKTILQGIATAEENPAEEQRLQRVLEELKSKDVEVVQAVDSLFTAIKKILVENSLTLRIAYRLQQVWSSAAESLRPLFDYLSPQAEAYKTYRQYSRASRLLHA